MLQKRKIPFDILDSIRGIASLYVAIAHCRGTLWVGGSEFSKMFPRENWDAGDYLMFGTSMLTRLAVEFVIVFFVLSGFSIAHSLSSDKSPLQFYKRRFIRIYPSYVAALFWAGLIFIITKIWHPQWYDGSMTNFAFIRTNEMNSYFQPEVVAKNLVYLPGGGFITPFWSLTYEVIFYLLAPFLLRNVKLYAGISLVLFAAHLVMKPVLLGWGLPIFVYEFLFVYNIYFVIGILLYNNYEAISAKVANFGKPGFGVLLMISLLLMYAVNFYFKTETDYSFMASALLGILLILYFLKFELRIPWLMSVGKFSYTLYITHLATIFLYLGIYWLIAKPGVPYILNYFVWMPAVIFVLAFAWLQYQLVEKRTKTWLNALRKKTV